MSAEAAPRRGSAANFRRSSAAFMSSEPRAGSWSNIRRASQGFPPPYTPDFDRRQSEMRRASATGEKIPEEEKNGDLDIREGEEKYHRLG